MQILYVFKFRDFKGIKFQRNQCLPDVFFCSVLAKKILTNWRDLSFSPQQQQEGELFPEVTKVPAALKTGVNSIPRSSVSLCKDLRSADI